MANKQLEEIKKNWGEVLEGGNPIKSEKIKKSTAVMLENEYKFLTGRVDETTA